MNLLARRVSFALMLSFAAAATACSAGDPSEPEAESTDAELSAGTILDLGSIAPGETKTVAYTPSPKHRAFSFVAKKGQTVDFWVRAPGGDAVAYILKPNRANLAQNDDADATTYDAHVSAKIKSDGTYFVAMKELKGRSLQLNVTFTGPPVPPPVPPLVVGVTWNGDLAREELHKVDLATMTHTLIAPIPDVGLTSSSFADPVHGRVYVNAAGADGVWRMHGIDATTGAVVSRAPMPIWTYDIDTGTNTGFSFSFFHVMADGRVVSVARNGDLARSELRSLDPVTMTHALVAPFVGSAGESFANVQRNALYVRSDGADSITRLVTIDATTGAASSNPPLPPFTYDEVTGGYHGFNFGGGFHAMKDGSVVTVTWNGDLAREEIRKVDPATMVHTLIAALPGINWTSSNFADPARGLVYVNGAGADGISRLFGIDATTGAIVSNPPMPAFTYDGATGTYHGFNFGGGLHVIR
jgi:hypothetical protein